MEKIKRSWNKNLVHKLVVVLAILLVISGCSSASKGKEDTSADSASKQSEVKKVTVADLSGLSSADAQKWCTDNGMDFVSSQQYSDTVALNGFISQSIAANSKASEGSTITVVYSLGKEPTQEEKNALAKAEDYSDTMHMSKQGIYDQLTSEYGEGFTAEAAQYAIDNLQADYNLNALETGKSYQQNMNMSKQAVYEQLTSEYGEKFTPEEAQYAIDNLPD